MRINCEEIYNTTYEGYKRAKKNILYRNILEAQSNAISNVIPGFDADKLQFGSYDKENFGVLFVDMRDSTCRAQRVGPEKTFLTMHIFLIALLEVIKCYQGKVIDIMGDGLMVFWGGKEMRESENIFKSEAMQYPGLCGRDMLVVLDKVINKIIVMEDLGEKISIGVGVTFGSVIVTKIGIESFYDVKAFGDCINLASKYASKSVNKVRVSQKVKDGWPKGVNGTIKFTSAKDGGFYLE